MTAVHKFLTPFASSGDRTAVPDVTQTDGTVSYQEGWGFDYSRNPATDPQAKRVDRGASNQLGYDLTSAVGDIQTHGFAEWITPTENGGVAYPYALGACVRLAGVVYQSLVDENTVQPGTDAAKWGVLGTPGNASAIAKGVVRLATPEEATAAKADDVAVTPAGLASAVPVLAPSTPAATTTLAGKVRLATPAEVGTFGAAAPNDVAVTPAGLACYGLRHGQCRMFSSANVISLWSWNGDGLIVNSRLYSLRAGVTQSFAGLGAEWAGKAALVYVAAAANGTLNLGLTATLDLIQDAAGVVVPTAAPQATVVGIVYVDAARNITMFRSFFNRLPQFYSSALTTSVTTYSTTWVEVSAGLQVPVLTFDDDVVIATATGPMGSGGSQYTYLNIHRDGAAVSDNGGSGNSAGGGQACCATTADIPGVRGLHTYSLFTKLSGNGVTFLGSPNVGERVSLSATVIGQGGAG